MKAPVERLSAFAFGLLWRYCHSTNAGVCAFAKCPFG